MGLSPLPTKDYRASAGASLETKSILHTHTSNYHIVLLGCYYHSKYARTRPNRHSALQRMTMQAVPRQRSPLPGHPYPLSPPCLTSAPAAAPRPHRATSSHLLPRQSPHHSLLPPPSRQSSPPPTGHTRPSKEAGNIEASGSIPHTPAFPSIHSSCCAHKLCLLYQGLVYPLSRPLPRPPGLLPRRPRPLSGESLLLISAAHPIPCTLAFTARTAASSHISLVLVLLLW